MTATKKLDAKQGERVAFAMQDASMLIERMLKKGRIPRREAAAVMNALADAAVLFDTNLPHIEED